MYTFNKMWGVVTPEEAAAKIEEQRKEITGEPKNLEEQAISLVGRDIYEKLIKGYTEKQWGRDCKDLPAFIIKRLPVRLTFDNNYFNALYQGIPIGGYTKMIANLLDGIEVRLNTDYLENKAELDELADKVVYTGPIDAYFDYKLGTLEYRSVRFENEILDMTPFLSIIIPIYKIKESYLRECFDSLLAQDMKDFQIIAVDDGSPDQSGDICDEYAQKDERVIVIHQENAGVSVARNAGIKAASTEWITFVDPDDWVESNHVSTLYNVQKKYNDFDIFWFDYVQEFDGKSNVKYLKDSSGVLDKEWVHNLKIAPFNFLSVNGRAYEYETNTIWNKMYRASLLKDNEMWFDPKARKGQDVIFNGFMITADNYGTGYSGTATRGMGAEAIRKKMESINPDKFKIRKFGVSDVIGLTAADKTSFFYVDKDRLVRFNGFFPKPQSGTYLILDEGGYQVAGQKGTWMVSDEVEVDGQWFVQMRSEQTKNPPPSIILHESGAFVTQTALGFDGEATRKMSAFLQGPKPELLHHQKFFENGTAERAKESGTEQNYNMIDGCVNNVPKKPRRIGGRWSVLDRLHIKQAERRQKDNAPQQEQERSRKS